MFASADKTVYEHEFTRGPGNTIDPPRCDCSIIVKQCEVWSESSIDHFGQSNLFQFSRKRVPQCVQPGQIVTAKHHQRPLA